MKPAGVNLASRIVAAATFAVPLLALALFLLPLVRYFGELAREPLGVALRTFGESSERAHLLRLAGRTLFIAALAATISACAGVAILLSAAGPGRSRRRILAASAALAFVLPGHFHAIAWILNLGYAGWVNRLLSGAQTLAAPENASLAPRLLYSPAGSAAIMALHLYPICAAACFAGVRSVPRLQTDATRVAAAPAGVWRTILAGPMRPWLLSGWLIVFLMAFTDYSTPALLRHQVFTVEIMTAYNAQYDPPRAMALTLPILLTAGLCAAALMATVRRIEFPSAGCSPDDLPAPAGNAALLFRLVVLTAALASAALPISTFAAQARGMEAWRLVLPGVIDQAAHTLTVLAVALPVIISIALCSAALLLILRAGSERRGRIAASVLTGVLVLLFALPPSVTAIAMIRHWNSPRIPGFFPDIYASGLMLPMGMTCMFAPVAFLFARSRSTGVPRPLLDAELLVRPASRFPWPRLQGPPMVRPLFAACAVVTVLIVHEAHASLLLVAPGQETLAIRSFTLLHYNPDSQVAAYCLMTAGGLCGLLIAGRIVFGVIQSAVRALRPDYALD